ncbi:MAG: lipoprotein-releasing ABC transporter permease subunit [Alphaproteobacteria bacterium]
MMFSALERMIAFRYLRSRRQEGFISVIAWFSLAGIALGVATLIVVMSVMNGFRAELLSRILGLNGHISIIAPNQAFTHYDQVAEQIRRQPGVIAVTPLAEGQALVIVGGRASGVVVRGMRTQDLAQRQILARNIKAGDLRNVTNGDVIIIGARMAQRLKVGIGDTLTLISPKLAETALGVIPRLKQFTIGAVFEIGMYEYDDSFVFMPLETAQAFLEMENDVSYIEVMINDLEKIEKISRDIFIALDGKYTVRDWQRVNQTFFTAIQVERNVMFLILTLMILVAAFNIISSLIMLVKDKSRDIAILRTMGASRRMVMSIFLLAGSSIGVLGTCIGTGLGVAFALNIESIRQTIQSLTRVELFSAEIYFLSKLPAILRLEDVGLVVSIAIGLSILATLYPSWRAARIDPIEALRYE